jgi:hypothetical protein
MLNEDEQERIIRANNQALEELALRGRNPKIGDSEPDVRKAIQMMVSYYFSNFCSSFTDTDDAFHFSYIISDARGEMAQAVVGLDIRLQEGLALHGSIRGNPFRGHVMGKDWADLLQCLKQTTHKHEATGVSEVREVPGGNFWGLEGPWEQIDVLPDDFLAALKRLVPDKYVYSGTWDWDETTWEWCLDLYDTQQECEGGYVTLAPTKDGKRFEYKIKPEPRHNQWAIVFRAVELKEIDFPGDFILVQGTLAEAKRKLDMLLGLASPPIPGYGG